MGAPDIKPLEECQLIDVEDIDAFIKSLPAVEQARMQWMRPMFLRVIDRVRSDKITPDMLATSAEDMMEICDAVVAVSYGVRLRLAHDWLEQVPRVVSFLADAAAADSAEYAMRAVGQLMASYRPTEQAPPPRRMSKDERPAFVRSDAGGLLRAQILLMAILSEHRERKSPERSRELAHHAMLEAQHGVGAVRREWPWFTPYAGETEVERRERLLRTVAQLREGLTEDEHATIFGGATSA